MRTKEGYLLIDHQASPGIPEDMARACGLDPKAVAGGKILEVGTLTCSHCKGTVVKSPFRKIERSVCAKCGHHYICDSCAFLASQPDYNHTPYEKRADLTFAGKAVTLTGQVVTLGSPPKLITP